MPDYRVMVPGTAVLNDGIDRIPVWLIAIPLYGPRFLSLFESHEVYTGANCAPVSASSPDHGIHAGLGRSTYVGYHFAVQAGDGEPHFLRFIQREAEQGFSVERIRLHIEGLHGSQLFGSAGIQRKRNR